MGLFGRKICSICGKKAEPLSGYKLRNKNYLCKSCAHQCSDDLSREDFEKMTPEIVKEHMAYVERNERVYEEKFEETDRITRGFLGMDSVLAYDLKHGWWIRPGSSTHDLYAIGSVKDCRFDMETSYLSENERKEQKGRKGDGEFTYGIYGSVFGGKEPGRKRCPPDRRIDRMFVDVWVEHPWVNRVRICTMDEVAPEPDDIRRGYETAEEIIRFFRNHKGGSADPVS